MFCSLNQPSCQIEKGLIEGVKHALIHRKCRRTEKYLPYVFEKEIKLIDVNWKGQYGSYCILTDSALANAKSIPPNQFKYLTRGMVRLSEDSALGFSLMTNEINTEKYQEMLSHIKSWIK